MTAITVASVISVTQKHCVLCNGFLISTYNEAYIDAKEGGLNKLKQLPERWTKLEEIKL